MALAGGCSPSTIGTLPKRPPSADASGTTDIDAGADGTRALAVLFVVDDGPGSQIAQLNLAHDFPAFMTALLETDAPIVRIGVVSTSMGSGASVLPGCPPGGDGGRLRGNPLAGACPSGVLEIDPGATPPDFSGALSMLFQCLSALGPGGCSVRQPLAAAAAAVAAHAATPDIVPAGALNAGFQGDDLVIIIATTEDDCSIPPASDLFDGSDAHALALGPVDRYRCYASGHVCAGGQHPPAAAPGTDLTLGDCHADPMSPLLAVTDYARFFQEGDLVGSPGPGHVAIGVLAGPPAPYVVTRAPDQDPVTGATTARAALASACSTGVAAYAAPAVRLSDFVAAMGPRAAFASACGDDIHGTLAVLGGPLRASLGGSFAPAARRAGGD